MDQKLEQACLHSTQVASAGKMWKTGGVFIHLLAA